MLSQSDPFRPKHQQEAQKASPAVDGDKSLSLRSLDSVSIEFAKVALDRISDAQIDSTLSTLLRECVQPLSNEAALNFRKVANFFDLLRLPLQASDRAFSTNDEAYPKLLGSLHFLRSLAKQDSQLCSQLFEHLAFTRKSLDRYQLLQKIEKFYFDKYFPSAGHEPIAILFQRVRAQHASSSEVAIAKGMLEIFREVGRTNCGSARAIPALKTDSQGNDASSFVSLLHAMGQDLSKSPNLESIHFLSAEQLSKIDWSANQELIDKQKRLASAIHLRKNVSKICEPDPGLARFFRISKKYFVRTFLYSDNARLGLSLVPSTLFFLLSTSFRRLDAIHAAPVAVSIAGIIYILAKYGENLSRKHDVKHSIYRDNMIRLLRKEQRFNINLTPKFCRDYLDKEIKNLSQELKASLARE